jgi:hypothetical protein
VGIRNGSEFCSLPAQYGKELFSKSLALVREKILQKDLTRLTILQFSITKIFVYRD